MTNNTISRKIPLKIIVLSASVIFISVLAAVFCINFYVKFSVRERILTINDANLTNADCILVLGAGVKQGNVPSNMLRDRLDTSLALFDAGVSDRLLMSGDHGRKDYDEVNVMKSYAVGAGVASECVFMDHAGFSTYESIYRAKEIFCADKIIIVTQSYHLYRALYIAEALGLDAYGVSSDLNTYGGQLYRDLREILARVKDIAMCIIKPEPTYLGDTIPLSGNGNSTNDDNSYANLL